MALKQDTGGSANGDKWLFRCVITTNDLDYVITGSDQVWNYRNTGLDRRFFLDFVEDSKKKISYAASFGVDHLPEEYIEEYRALLQDFSHLSVREEQGKALIQKTLRIDKEVDVVLDPVLLLEKSEWENVVNPAKPKSSPYILVYLFSISNTMPDFVKSLARKTGCKVVCLSHSYFGKIKGQYERTAGPEEFVSLFLNAEYVVTNSFHGTAFALNFNKQFFTELLPSSSKVNSRLENILDVFNLRDRQLIGGQLTDPLCEIDYKKVNKILHEKREKSIDFLKKGMAL